MSGLQTSVRYASDGGSAVWHVPFPYALPGDVGVKLISADGQERRLSLGVDYVIDGSSVTCVVPAGSSIVLWLDGPLDGALAAGRTASRGAYGVSDGALAQTLARLADSLDAQVRRQSEEEAAARERLTAEADALLARSREAARAEAVSSVSAEAATQAEAMRRTAETLTESLRSEADAAVRRASDALDQATRAGRRLDEATASLDTARSSLTDTAARGCADVRDVGAAATRAVRQAQSTALAHIDAAIRRASAAARLSGGTGNAEALLVPETDIPAGTELPLPGGLIYQPGRGMLLAFYPGCALALGRHFAEVGDEDATSGSVRLLFGARAGDELLFRVIATNSRVELEAVTKRAEVAADAAEGSAEEAGKAADRAEQAREKAGDAQWYAEKWAENAAISAEQAHGSASCAWDAAYQACMAAQPDRPGMAAVRDAGELDGALSGAFFLNPFLHRGPTNFMGVWPVPIPTVMPLGGIAGNGDGGDGGDGGQSSQSGQSSQTGDGGQSSQPGQTGQSGDSGQTGQSGQSGAAAGEDADIWPAWDGFFFLGPAYPDTPLPPPPPPCTERPQRPDDPTPPDGGDPDDPDGGDPDDPDGSGPVSDGQAVVWGPCRK